MKHDPLQKQEESLKQRVSRKPRKVFHTLAHLDQVA
jgi:hypothetical protein